MTPDTPETVVIAGHVCIPGTVAESMLRHVARMPDSPTVAADIARAIRCPGYVGVATK